MDGLQYGTGMRGVVHTKLAELSIDDAFNETILHESMAHAALDCA